MIKEAVEGITSLATALRNRPVSTIIAALIIAFAFILYTKIDFLVKDTSPSAEVETARFNASRKADKLINLELERLRVEANADRALVRTFHNNEKDMSRTVHFRSVKTEWYVTRDGIILSPTALQPFPLGPLQDITETMFGSQVTTPSCILGDVSEVDMPAAYRRYLEANGVEAFAQCPLVSEEGAPIGFVGVGFVRQQTITLKEPLETIVRRRTSKIENVLHKLHDETKVKAWYDIF
ncbi:hypothetical protein PF049_00230 [Erythrobacteraceae bacterium WH01K]|nr:hypothetical protein PF049_00230 [Erythrobacteraceae bacterium WH01K]